MLLTYVHNIFYKGPSKNYVVSIGPGGDEGGSPKDDLLNRPYFADFETIL